MAFNVEYLYTVVDRFSGPLRKITDKTKRFGKAAGDARRKVASLGDRAGKAASKFEALAGAIGGAAIIGGLKKFVDRAVNVESAIADLVRVGDFAKGTLGKFTQSMEDLSEKTGADKIGLLRQGFQGLKMGIPIKELASFVVLGSRVAGAFDFADDEAGRSLGSIRAKLGLTTDKLKILMDSSNYLADNFAADGARMINIIERTSGVMSALRVPPQYVAGFAAFADQIEVTQELAASGMRQMFSKMRQDTKLNAKLIANPFKAVEGELQRLADLPESKRFPILIKKYGAEAAKFVEKAVNNIDLLRRTMRTALSPEATDSMIREEVIRLKTTEALINRMIAGFKNMGDAIGTALIPAYQAILRVILKAEIVVKKFTKAHPAIVQFGVAIAVLVAGVALIAVPLGILIAMVGALVTPIAAAMAGIMALAGVFIYWTDSANPIIEVLTGIGSEIGKTILAFGEIFGLTAEGADAFDVLFHVLKKIGEIIAVILGPVQMLLRAIRGMVEALAKLRQLDFSGYWDAVTSTGSDLLDIGGKMGGNIASLFEFGDTPEMKKQGELASERAANNNIKTSVELSGNITASAEPGSKITNSVFDLNTGSNMEFAK